MAGRYRTYDGPHNQPSIDQIIAELMERVRVSETPRQATSSQQGLSATNDFHAYDMQGNEALGTDLGAGHGLQSPRIPLQPMTVAEYTTPSQTTTSATFVPLFYIHGRQQHSAIECKLLVNVPAANVGEVRVMNYTDPINPVQVGITATLNPTTAGTYADISGTLSSYVQNVLQVFRIEARRVSGAGSIGVAVAWFYGKGA
jgi:hypothetical protein